MVIRVSRLWAKCFFFHTITSGFSSANWCIKTSTDSKSLHARLLILDIYEKASSRRQRCGLCSLLFVEGHEESLARDRHTHLLDE